MSNYIHIKTSIDNPSLNIDEMFSISQILELLWGRYWNKNKRMVEDSELCKLYFSWIDEKNHECWKTNSIVKLADGTFSSMQDEHFTVALVNGRIGITLVHPAVEQYEFKFGGRAGLDKFQQAVFLALPQAIQEKVIHEAIDLSKIDAMFLAKREMTMKDYMNMKMEPFIKIIQEEKESLARSKIQEKMEEDVIHEEVELEVKEHLLKIVPEVIADIKMRKVGSDRTLMDAIVDECANEVTHEFVETAIAKKDFVVQRVEFIGPFASVYVSALGRGVKFKYKSNQSLAMLRTALGAKWLYAGVAIDETNLMYYPFFRKVKAPDKVQIYYLMASEGDDGG